MEWSNDQRAKDESSDGVNNRADNMMKAFSRDITLITQHLKIISQSSLHKKK